MPVTQKKIFYKQLLLWKQNIATSLPTQSIPINTNDIPLSKQVVSHIWAERTLTDLNFSLEIMNLSWHV